MIKINNQRIEFLESLIEKYKNEIKEIKRNCPHESVKYDNTCRVNQSMVFECIDKTCEDCGEVIDIEWGKYVG